MPASFGCKSSGRVFSSLGMAFPERSRLMWLFQALHSLSAPIAPQPLCSTWTVGAFPIDQRPRTQKNLVFCRVVLGYSVCKWWLPGDSFMHLGRALHRRPRGMLRPLQRVLCRMAPRKGAGGDGGAEGVGVTGKLIWCHVPSSPTSDSWLVSAGLSSPFPPKRGW